MNTANPNWAVMGVILIIFIVALVGAWVYTQRRKQSERLRSHYGPEYERTVERLGNRSKAEADLMAREKRVEGLHIVTLTATDAGKFGQAWNTLQGRFVDNPKGAVVQADRLVTELMAKRGYPMGDFDHRAADISVDHPGVVANYRTARAIALRAENGEATTEDLRKAVVHYRALFDELLEVGERRTAVSPNQTQNLSVQP